MSVYGIDLGHTLSGSNYGSVGFIKESEETRRVGNLVIKYLQQLGHKVINCTVDTAKTNSDSINQRVAKANAQPLDLLISIHFNASNGQGYGTEILTYQGKNSPEAERILKNISALGFRNRGIKNGTTPRRIAVLNSTKSKSLLVEVCFVDNKNDVDLYKKNVDNVAKAIVEGITGQKIGGSTNSVNSDTKTSVDNSNRISDTTELHANINSPIKDKMIEEIKLLQKLMGLEESGRANGELIRLLPQLTGVETKGCVRIMQRILQHKSYAKEIDTGVIGNACKGAIQRFKESVSIPVQGTKLVDYQTWLKLLEY